MRFRENINLHGINLKFVLFTKERFIHKRALRLIVALTDGMYMKFNMVNRSSLLHLSPNRVKS